MIATDRALRCRSDRCGRMRQLRTTHVLVHASASAMDYGCPYAGHPVFLFDLTVHKTPHAGRDVRQDVDMDAGVNVNTVVNVSPRRALQADTGTASCRALRAHALRTS